ncbi:MAG TPA: ATP-binding protein [Planctomycetota bacterium]|nr:ATP-binding protein [Planctomycetota bacterium]
MRLSASDVLRCMEGGEGTRVEFKRVLPRDDRAVRTLCAFANTRGGLLIVGITDRGRVHGVHEPERVRSRLEKLAEVHVLPPLAVATQVVEVGGPRVVACSVPFSNARPHAVQLPGTPPQVLVRVGASNRIADGPTLAALRRNAVSRNGRNPLEDAIVGWVRAQSKIRARPSGSATVAGFAKAFNVGEARAHRTFVRLESRGLLVGHGAGRSRVFTAP